MQSRGEVMREKEYSEWMGKQGFDVLRHANCCKIAFNGGWESRQTEVDDLQKRVDAASELIAEIKDGYFGECYEVHDIANKLERAFKGGIK